MLKHLYILFVFCSFYAFAQQVEENPSQRKVPDDSFAGFPKLDYPKFIPVNSTFDISLITANSFPSADRLELYIIPGERVYLNKLEFRSVYEKIKLGYSPASFEDHDGIVYKAKITLSDSLYAAGAFFQILSTFKSENISSSSVKFYGIFKEGEKILGKLVSDEFTDDKDLSELAEREEEFLKADLSFYKPQKTADNSISFNNPSSLSISFKNIETDDLSCGFWLRVNDPEISFLKILNKETSAAGYEFSINSFQMLTVNSASNLQEYLDPIFIGKKSWYHINIIFHFKEGIVEFYCDEILLSRLRVREFIKKEDLIFRFENADEKKSFQLDLLRFADIEKPGMDFSDINSVKPGSGYQKIISQFKFESGNEILNNRQNADVEFSGAKIIKSDAPIFAKAPELNINVLGKVYELEWSGGDYKQAKTYALEKSKGGSEYFSVFMTTPDNSIEKKYTFLDQKDESSDIVYYRVKQTNVDGSVVYSSQVKVGQGLIEPFKVEQNFPNPFNPKTSIEVELLEDSEIEITIYNLEGREISKLYKGFLSKGIHKFDFDASELTSGIYLYEVATPNYSQTRKMIFTK